jgi:hypothetical protein
MKKGMTWKFPFFLYHFRAASWMKETGFKYWGHWKISPEITVVNELTVPEHIPTPSIAKNNRI